MPPWFHAFVAWLRRQFAWSNSRQSWQERLGLLALGGTGIGGWYVSRSWDVELRVVLGCAWLLLLAVLMRRGLVKLFGPVFFFEALRGTRRRIHLYRALYAVALFVAIGWVWASHADGSYRSELTAQAEFAQTVFLTFFCVEMLVVFLLTPVAVASAIAEEKERRTLEFVLATDLRSREILFGKLAGRMANMSLYLLAGLPILAILQLMGGIDPDLLLASVAVAVITFFGMAALSILMSVLQRRSREAIVLTFLAIVAYHIFSGASYALLEIPGVPNWSATFFGTPVTANDFIDFFNSGNLVTQTLSVIKAMEFGDAGIHELIGPLLRNYAIFHGIVIVVSLTWAALRLRPVAKAQMAGGQSRRARATRRHPEIGRWPMIWKEVFADTPRMHWLQKTILAVIVILSFVPPVWITAEHIDKLVLTPPGQSTNIQERWRRWDDPWYAYGRAMNGWVRGISALGGTLLLMAVAVRAAGSISGERGKQTLDELLATPLTNDEIVVGKWLGAILSVRRGWIWVGVVLFTGGIAGGLNFFGALATISAWFIFAAVFAGIGLWFSMRCRNTFRATVLTVLTSLFLLGFHWLLFLFCCMLPTAGMGGRGDTLDVVASAQLGLTPPATLGLFPISGFDELEHMDDEEGILVIVFQFVGVGVYAVMAVAMLPILIQRFAANFSRTTIRRPAVSKLRVAPSDVSADEPVASATPQAAEGGQVQ